MTLKPDTRTIQDLFGQPYQIDFYQREYKWSEAHVLTLLDDVFFKFNQHYTPSLDVTPDTVTQFGWYYLNTIVTNQVEGSRYIVDGQQRLTTLTLILIALHHLARRHKLDEDRIELLKSRIYGTGLKGKAYWMGADGREHALAELLQRGQDATKSGDEPQTLTQRNMRKNYGIIHANLEKRLDDPHRLDAFILYYLSRIELESAGQRLRRHGVHAVGIECFDTSQIHRQTGRGQFRHRLGLPAAA